MCIQVRLTNWLAVLKKPTGVSELDITTSGTILSSQQTTKILIRLCRFIHVISFRGASGRFSFYFREVYENCIDFSFRWGRFQNFKVVCFRRNFTAHFRELPEDQGGTICIYVCRCADWSRPLLFTYGINRFCQDVAQLWKKMLENHLNLFIKHNVGDCIHSQTPQACRKF